MNTATLQVPLPSEEQMREILLEAAENIMRERDNWLSLDEAAKYLGLSRRAFDDCRKRYRIPVSEINRRIYRPDLDQILASRMVQPPGAKIIDFHSIQLRKQTISHISA